jgi:hypothetical protein
LFGVDAVVTGANAVAYLALGGWLAINSVAAGIPTVPSVSVWSCSLLQSLPTPSGADGIA